MNLIIQKYLFQIWIQKYKLHFRGFGFCDKADSYCRINDDPVYLRWGVAWYRNLEFWMQLLHL